MLDSYRFRSCFQGGKYPREGNDHDRSEKDARLGDLYLAVGNVSEALAYYRKAMASIAMNDEDARLAVVLKASACLRRQGQAEEALAFVESIQTSFGGRCRRDLLAEKATLLCLAGRYGEATRVCEEAQNEEAGHDRAKDARIYLILGHVLAMVCRWQQAIVCLEQAATFGRMCGDLTTRGNALNNLGIVYKNLCRFRESARFLEKAVDIARRQDDDASLAVRLLNLATTLFKMGDVEKAYRTALDCQRIATTLNLARVRVQASICRARLEIAKGDLDSARVNIDQAVASAQGIDDPRLHLVSRETLADMLIEQGRFIEARHVLEECVVSISPHAKDVDAELKTRLASVYIALGHRRKAAACAEAAAGLAESIGDLYEAGRALRLMAVAGGRDAGEHMARAEGIFGRIGAELELAVTLHARSRLAGYDQKTSVACLERSVGVLRGCGARSKLVRALCDLALAYERGLEHERALSCLSEADSIGGAHFERKMITAARLKVDRSLASRFASNRGRRPVTPDHAMEVLRERFGVEGLVLAKDALDDGPAVVQTWGIAGDVAGDLVRLVGKDCPNPVIYSSVPVAADSGRPAARPGSLLAVRFGTPDSQAMLIATWPRNGTGGQGGGKPHVMLGVYYELLRLAPVFEAAGPVRHLGQPLCIGGMLTADPALKSVLLSLPRIAEGSASVLITGETGTGKELVARVLHAMSRRRAGPMVIQNCAALPEQLLESELFGHKAGAFTGARADKKGLLEAAGGGTFFFDEIGEVSPAIQAKILRAIETGEIRRVGDTISRTIDARFMSATNVNLEDAVERGSFRRDLYYRINVVKVNLPPLKERHGDVELLANLFLKRFSKKINKSVKHITDEAMRALAAYDWPGNVRQLENEVEKSVTMVDPEEAITVDLLSPCITGIPTVNRPVGLKDELRMVESRRILAALRRCSWNKTHAARQLGGISRPALIAKMKRLGIPLKPPGRMGPTV